METSWMGICSRRKCVTEWLPKMLIERGQDDKRRINLSDRNIL